jgi:Tol biopolymer transport system component
MRRWSLLTLSGALALSLGAGQPVGPTISAPEKTSFFGLTPQFAVSPSGEQVVFVATANGTAALWLRSLSSGDARRLPGTEQATYPFWSPDNQSIGFFAAGKLEKIRITDHAPVVVCDAPAGRGATWSADDVIVFASGINDPLRRVAAAGGAPSPVTVVEPPLETSHRWPHFLPDGRHILFWAGAGTAPAQLKIASLDSREIVTVVPASTNGAYAAGYLFFGSGSALMALPFDAKSFAKTGEPIRVDDPVSGDAGSNFLSFSVSATGTLLRTHGSARPLVLTWFDRAGKSIGTLGAPGQYTNVALAPDGKRVAVSLTAGTPANRDVWILDPAAAASRVTTDPAVDATPIWSPDGSQIAFSSQRSGPYQIYRSASMGLTPAEAELLLKSDVASIATDWSHDGGYVVFTHGTTATGLDVRLLRLSDRATLPVLADVPAQDNAAFSPDGKWLAYQSNRSGRDEVYVVSLGATESATAKTTPAAEVSVNGGTQPLWRGDSRELFFLAPDGTVMSAAVTPASSDFRAEPARSLFPAPMSLVLRRAYAVTSDGARFLIPVLDESNPPVITVEAGWLARTR